MMHTGAMAVLVENIAFPRHHRRQHIRHDVSLDNYVIAGLRLDALTGSRTGDTFSATPIRCRSPLRGWFYMYREHMATRQRQR